MLATSAADKAANVEAEVAVEEETSLLAIETLPDNDLPPPSSPEPPAAAAPVAEEEEKLEPLAEIEVDLVADDEVTELTGWETSLVSCVYCGDPTDASQTCSFCKNQIQRRGSFFLGKRDRDE